MEIDAWLRGGGIVITASDHAARALDPEECGLFPRFKRGSDLQVGQDFGKFIFHISQRDFVMLSIIGINAIQGQHTGQSR